MSYDHSGAASDDQVRAWIGVWRAALALTVAEPVLAVWSFAQAPATGDADTPVVLAITPTTVRAYTRGAHGDIDAAHERAVWHRQALRVSVVRDRHHVTLGLGTTAGQHVELRAPRHAEADRFVRLIGHPVGV